MIIAHGGMADETNYNPSPTESEKEEIRNICRVLYHKFLQTETEIILDQYQEIYIRGAAKMAGLSHVTDFVPKKVDWNFVNEIKQAIREKKK